MQMETELFGYDRDHLAFSQVAQLGVFEQMQGGTIVLYNAEYMEPDIQRQLAGILKKGAFTKVGGRTSVPLRSRIILICRDEPQQLDGHNRLLPSLYALVAKQHFQAAPLREHRRDIPRLIQYYLKRYNLQYGKNITRIDDQTLGKFINYDWPGNLTELASVMQRAVILGKNNEPLTDQLLLGVPRPEGKWEFNLLRFSWVRAAISHPFFPVLPRAVVGMFFICVLAVLFFGPSVAEKNIGLTLSWVVGWPLLIFGFFFLARIWCSVCGLSVPGWLAQTIIRPERPTPRIIRHYSGWIMAFLCILLFWIETAWNAYASPRLTAMIIFSITMGSLIFSMLYKRRVWCRYLCPLGAINALFSMPSILELRSNAQMCMNRCDNHSCYTGDDHAAGCPMFRHPFLVDNNRDCILCGQCIKNCKLNSIHLNLRLAPQELWNQQAPRLSDSFLVVSLAAIFYPFAINQSFPSFFENTAATLQFFGFPSSIPLAASCIFFSCIAVYLGGYTAMSHIMTRMTGNNWKTTAAILGYGMIPLVLGAFMAAHLEIFVNGLWLLPANLMDLFGIGGEQVASRVISRDATIVLQIITVVGGLIASLYATHRIIRRLVVGRPYASKMFTLPAVLLGLSALAYLQLV
jgi:polyferredoxin